MSERTLPANAVLEDAACIFQCPKMSGCEQGGECKIDRSVVSYDGEECHHNYQFARVNGSIVALVAPSGQIIWLS